MDSDPLGLPSGPGFNIRTVQAHQEAWLWPAAPGWRRLRLLREAWTPDCLPAVCTARGSAGPRERDAPIAHPTLGLRGSLRPGEVGPRAQRSRSRPRPGVEFGAEAPRREAPLPPPEPSRVGGPWPAEAPGLLPVFQAAPQHLGLRTAGEPGWAQRPGLGGAQTCAGARAATSRSLRARPARRRAGPGVPTATRRVPALRAGVGGSAAREGRGPRRPPRDPPARSPGALPPAACVWVRRGGRCLLPGL